MGKCWWIGFLGGALLAAAGVRADGARKITYEQDVLPVLRNSCLNCHNPDKKKAGLDLSNYSGLMAGSDNGKVVSPGDPGGSLLAKTIAHTEEPFMPKNGDRLAPAQIALINGWIMGGALESSSSHAAASPTNDDLSVVVAKIGRPPGPPPMPEVRLSIEPILHTARPGAITALAANPWSPLAAVAGPHQIVLYNTQTLDLLGIFAAPEEQLNVLRFSQDGSLLLAAGGEAAKSGRVTIYDVKTVKKVAQVGNEFDAILAADMSPDHAMIAVGTTAKILRAYDVHTGQPAYTMKKHTDWVTAVAFSPDGKYLASGDRAGNIYVIEAKTGRDLYSLSGHTDAIDALAFRDDGKILVSASQDQFITLWNMKDGSQISRHSGHVGGTTCVAFSHDGRVVSCGRDHVVAVWDARVAQNVGTEAFADIALQCAFTDDGKRVIAGDWSGQIKVFNAADGSKVGELTADPASPADRLATARDHVTQLYTEAEKLTAEAGVAKENREKANSAMQLALAGQGGKDLLAAMRQVQKATAAKGEAMQALAKAKALAQQKQNDIDTFTQKKAHLGVVLENVKNDGARENIRQRIAQNEDQLKQANKDKAAADDAVAPRQKAFDEAEAKLKEAGDAMASAMKAADAQARQLPASTVALRNANAAMEKANQVASAATTKLKGAQEDLKRLQASIAAATGSGATTRAARAALN